MKRIAYVIPVIAMLFLGACTLRMSATQTPTAIVLGTDAPLETAAPVNTEAPLVSEAARRDRRDRSWSATRADAGAARLAAPTEPPVSPSPTAATQDNQAAATKPSATPAAPATTSPASGSVRP